MPFIRELYEEFHEIKEVAAVLTGEVVTAETQAGCGESRGFASELTGDVTADLAAARLLKSPVKKNNIFNIKNKQQQTTTTPEHSFLSKSPISENFYPTQETIELAGAEGLDGVTCESQITAFIRYNQANGSLWADYNPVFITWLKRDAERTRAAEQTKQPKGQFTRNNHEYRAHEGRVKGFSLDEVYAANANAIAPDGSRYFKETGRGLVIDSACCVGVDRALPDIWTTVFE